MAGPERVLVVEDDELVSDLLGTLLRAEGYTPITVTDGAEAVQRVPVDCPDAILLDVMLPGMNGFEVCRKLKLRRETNLIPILMLTALTDADSRKSGLRVGANRYITKPFEPAQMLQELRALLDNHRRLVEGRVRAHVELHMESDSDLREQLNDLLDELFQQTPLTGEDIGRLRYAVMEMTQNAIEWGNRKQRDRQVTIGYHVLDDHLTFTITDEGSGFDPTSVPHAASEEDPVSHMDVREQLGLRAGGFGILITKGLVDEVRYNERGNQVTLVKRFPNGQQEPPAEGPCATGGGETGESR